MKTTLTLEGSKQREIARARARLLEGNLEDFDVRELGGGRAVFTDSLTGRQYRNVADPFVGGGAPSADDVDLFVLDGAGKVIYLRERGRPRQPTSSMLLSTITFQGLGKTDPSRPPAPIAEDPPTLEQRIAALEKESG